MPRSVKQVLEAARRPDNRRSPVFAWMWKYRAQLEHALADKVLGLSWSALAENFAKMGVHDRTGKPPKSETVRQTWVKVQKAAGSRTKPVGKVVRSPLSSVVLLEGAPRERPKLDFKPAKVRE